MPAMRKYIHLLWSLPVNPYHQTKDKTSVSKAAFSGKIHHLCTGTVTTWSLGAQAFLVYVSLVQQQLSLLAVLKSRWCLSPLPCYRNRTDLSPQTLSIVQTNKSDDFAMTAQKGVHHLRKAAAHSKEASACGFSQNTFMTADSSPGTVVMSQRSLLLHPALPAVVNSTVLSFVGLPPTCL